MGMTSGRPVFHQVAYALAQGTTTFRMAYLLYTRLNETKLERDVKKEVYRLERLGSAIFMFGFFVWNVENQLYVFHFARQRRAVINCCFL